MSGERESVCENEGEKGRERERKGVRMNRIIKVHDEKVNDQNDNENNTHTHTRTPPHIHIL